MSPINKIDFLKSIKQGVVANSTPATTFKVQPQKKQGQYIMDKGKKVPYDGNVYKRTQDDLKGY